MNGETNMIDTANSGTTVAAGVEAETEQSPPVDVQRADPCMRREFGVEVIVDQYADGRFFACLSEIGEADGELGTQHLTRGYVTKGGCLSELRRVCRRVPEWVVDWGGVEDRTAGA